MLERLLTSEKLLKLKTAFHEGEDLLIEELWNAPKSLVAALAQQATGKHILLLTGSSQDEAQLFHDFPLFTDRPIIEFPAWETLPTEKVPPSPDVVGERYQTLHQVTTSNEPHLIISSLQAALQKLIIPKTFQALYLELEKGQNHPFETLIEWLKEMGYERTPVASDKGEFAVRGGIIDIFPVSKPDPYRIEFWGDDIESIRIYDPIGQKSVNTVDKIEITPARELELLDKNNELGTILNYLGKETLVVFDDLLALEDRYASLMSICGKTSRHFCSLDEFLDQLVPFQKLFLAQQPIEELSEVKTLSDQGGGYYSETAPLHKIGFEIFSRPFTAKRWSSPFVPIVQYLLPDRAIDVPVSSDELLIALSNLPKETFSLDILCESDAEETDTQKRVLEAGVTLPDKTHYHLGYLSSGFIVHDSQTAVFPLTELTHNYKIRRQKLRSTYHTPPSEVFDLNAGDIVVHLNNGIGRFVGMERRPDHNGVLNEFFQVEYANNAKLFVPINQSHLVTKYIGSTEGKTHLHELGSKKWQRTKARTEKAILGYAQDLLETYAKRSLKGGFSYPEDTDDIAAFAKAFPFVETGDQLSALADIREDMCSVKSMDRLICGDVGYGKTEVAMRAAFKAVVDGGKQVAILVPTTMLAMQHYETFVARMKHFPINIGVLSRFRTAKEARQVLEGVSSGSIDILIGTHRIIRDDVRFKDLGLVIIDEEQRFGVKAKEHLKQAKQGVDCLTLSATPIPRTLYMSLVGARDMSVINTPPQDRLPISTVIGEPTDDLIRNALLRELARDGQAFVIHNRVESIYGVADRIKKLLPKARVIVGHGQMSSKELDLVFHAFKSGDADILVATTIVESGIDIPNANTVLIDRADIFGLADLYQIRGRVGRWNRRAYAYFLVPSVRALPEISRRRLNALAESSGYGGGMKLAMRDLEIRGAGDILGTEQSGHVSAIGFHFYCKMLKRTIQALQGKIDSVLADTKLEFPYDARLPDEYINETQLRMEIYQKLSEAISWEEVATVWAEIKDRFGSPPEPVRWLYHLTRVRVWATLHGFTLLKFEKNILIAERSHKGELTTQRLPMPPPEAPEEVEQFTLKTLKKYFNLNG